MKNICKLFNLSKEVYKFYPLLIKTCLFEELNEPVILLRIFFAYILYLQRLQINIDVSLFICNLCRGTSINDVLRFLAIFDLPTYLVPTLPCPITSDFGGYFGPPPLPTLKSDVIYGRSHTKFNLYKPCDLEYFRHNPLM